MTDELDEFNERWGAELRPVLLDARMAISLAFQVNCRAIEDLVAAVVEAQRVCDPSGRDGAVRELAVWAVAAAAADQALFLKAAGVAR